MTDDDDLGSAQTMMTRTPDVSDAQISIADSMPSVIADRYEVLGLLGVGGMGRVYRVLDRRLDETVALKVLRRELIDAPGMLDRFRQEVRLARRVTSPHVVRTFDLGEHDGDHFLTMELVDGQSLAHLLDAGPLSRDAALRIARAACAGIDAAHTAGVLHRDLKPDNILVARDGRIAITDFGIARAHTDPRATNEGFIGTPAYMAPEQLDTAATIGPAADLYALGAILFEMLTERRPFPGSDPFAVALARLHRPPPDPRDYADLPAPLAELVLRCLARDPSARPANAAALAALLDSIASTPAPAAAPMRPIVPAPNTSRAIAFLPLRATGDLVELADGLSEEIVDALTMTRELRIRPITAARAVHRPDQDVRETGKLLGVDVIVEGSMRRRGELVRISARAIGVTDGFQLWANHFDSAPSGLLEVGDQVAQAVARALTVEIDLPTRVAPSAHALELYLEAKAKLRALWYVGTASAIPALEQAHQLAPDHPGILATLAMAIARSAFFTSDGGLPIARELAERAVALAPGSGEAWFALGLAQFYANEVPAAAVAIRRALGRATGLAMAQNILGAILLEAGAVDDAIAHLEAAIQLDPGGSYSLDLARAYVYRSGDYTAAFGLIEQARGFGRILDLQAARLRLWQGQVSKLEPILPQDLPAQLRNYFAIIGRSYGTGRIDEVDREALTTVVKSMNIRLRTANAQFVTELDAFSGKLDAALEFLEIAVDAKLQDYLWLQRCPALDPLRASPRFIALTAVVAKRAADVIAALREPD